MRDTKTIINSRYRENGFIDTAKRAQTRVGFPVIFSQLRWPIEPKFSQVCYFICKLWYTKFGPLDNTVYRCCAIALKWAVRQAIYFRRACHIYLLDKLAVGFLKCQSSKFFQLFSSLLGFQSHLRKTIEQLKKGKVAGNIQRRQTSRGTPPSESPSKGKGILKTKSDQVWEWNIFYFCLQKVFFLF